MKKIYLVLLLAPLIMGLTGCVFKGHNLAPPPAPLGFSLRNLEVYPNPFIPSEGHTHITFNHLPFHTEIYIYTLPGELIIASGEVGEIWIWDVKDSEGKEISRDTYIYVVISQEEKKTDKITVIK